MSIYIADTAIIYPDVILGHNIRIEDYCIIGIPINGQENLRTVISDGAVLRAGTYIYAGTTIGVNFKSGNKVNIRELCIIGSDVSIGTLTVLEHNVKVGNHVRVHSQAFLPEYTILEDGAWVGPNVVLTNSLYPNHENAKNELKGCHIKKNARIGANSTILPGIKIGEASLIGAGSVVTKNVPNNSIMAGNPAVFLRKNSY